MGIGKPFVKRNNPGLYCCTKEQEYKGSRSEECFNGYSFRESERPADQIHADDTEKNADRGELGHHQIKECSVSGFFVLIFYENQEE